MYSVRQDRNAGAHISALGGDVAQVVEPVGADGVEHDGHGNESHQHDACGRQVLHILGQADGRHHLRIQMQETSAVMCVCMFKLAVTRYFIFRQMVTITCEAKRTIKTPVALGEVLWYA